MKCENEKFCKKLTILLGKIFCQLFNGGKKFEKKFYKLS